MFYHKFNLHPSFCGVNTSIERYPISKGDGNVTFEDLYESDYRNLHPVPFVATSLPALQAAGINPQEINVSCLLDPTNVGTMQHISERVLNDFALDYNPSSDNPLDNV